MSEQQQPPPQPPLSPCIHVCLLDAARRQCIGCHRTREEIAGWWAFRDDEKRKILDQLPARQRG